MKYKLKKVNAILTIMGSSFCLGLSGCSKNANDFSKKQNKTMNYERIMEADSNSCAISYKMNKKLEELEELANKEYSVEDLKVLITNNSLGKPQIRFIYLDTIEGIENILSAKIAGLNTYSYSFLYRSVTDPAISYWQKFTCFCVDDKNYCHSSIPDISASNSCWVPDYHVNKIILDISDFTCLNFNEKKITVQELKDVEEQINQPNFDLYSFFVKNQYKIEDLIFYGNSDQLLIFDQNDYAICCESDNLEDINSHYPAFYYYNILNPKEGIKVRIEGMNFLSMLNANKEDHPYKNKIVTYTSMNPEDTLDSNNIFWGLLNLNEHYLTSEQIQRGYVTYEEIIQLQDKILEDRRYREELKRSLSIG